MTQRHKAVAALVAVVALVGVVPLALDRDSFPLSTYPMFSSRRSSTESVDTAVTVADDGTTVRLSPTVIAGTDEVILATATVTDAIRSGTADLLCTDIARRVVERQAAPTDQVVAVEVVTERFDAVRWYDGDRSPLERRVHARCDLPAGGIPG